MKLEDIIKMEGVVLLYDEHIPCSKWKMGHIVKVYLDSCNRVCQVLVLYGEQGQKYARYYLKSNNAFTLTRVVLWL